MGKLRPSEDKFLKLSEDSEAQKKKLEEQLKMKIKEDEVNKLSSAKFSGDFKKTIQLKLKVGILEEHLQDIKDEYDNLKTENKNLDNRIDTIEAVKKELSDEIDKMKVMLVENNNEKESLKNENAEITSANEKLRKKIGYLNEKNEKNQQKAVETDKLIHSLQVGISNLRDFHMSTADDEGEKDTSRQSENYPNSPYINNNAPGSIKRPTDDPIHASKSKSARM